MTKSQPRFDPLRTLECVRNMLSKLVRPAAAVAARMHAGGAAASFPLAARRLGAWGAQGSVRGFAKKKQQEVEINVSPQGSMQMLRAAVKTALEVQEPEVRSNILGLADGQAIFATAVFAVAAVSL